MSLVLSVQKAPDSVVRKESCKTFGREGGTIGRGQNNTWVLDDPERVLSSIHCEISFEDDQFYIKDRSTNGTYLNGSSEPIGKGKMLPIHNNDTLFLGDYEFLIAESNKAPDGTSEPGEHAHDRCDGEGAIPKNWNDDEEVSPTSTGQSVIADRSFIDALGLNDKGLTDADIVKINQLAGEVFREMVNGLMMILAARNTINKEFRINVTNVQPEGNNPLKFSPNVDDALDNMFLKQGRAFLEPLEAVRDGIESMANHQMAILTGMQEALKGVIERFEPEVLEEQFAKRHQGGVLPFRNKAQNWGSYVDYYNELVSDSDKSFKNLYGDEFVRAYEERLKVLSILKKPSKI